MMMVARRPITITGFDCGRHAGTASGQRGKMWCCDRKRCWKFMCVTGSDGKPAVTTKTRAVQYEVRDSEYIVQDPSSDGSDAWLKA